MEVSPRNRQNRVTETRDGWLYTVFGALNGWLSLFSFLFFLCFFTRVICILVNGSCCVCMYLV